MKNILMIIALAVLATSAYAQIPCDPDPWMCYENPDPDSGGGNGNGTGAYHTGGCWTCAPEGCRGLYDSSGTTPDVIVSGMTSCFSYGWYCNLYGGRACLGYDWGALRAWRPGQSESVIRYFAFEWDARKMALANFLSGWPGITAADLSALTQAATEAEVGLHGQDAAKAAYGVYKREAERRTGHKLQDGGIFVWPNKQASGNSMRADLSPKRPAAVN